MSKEEIIVVNEKGKSRSIPLPQYGEVTFIVHDGKIKYIEQREKTKLE